jgi:hypothetical protein
VLRSRAFELKAERCFQLGLRPITSVALFDLPSFKDGDDLSLRLPSRRTKPEIWMLPSGRSVTTDTSLGAHAGLSQLSRNTRKRGGTPLANSDVHFEPSGKCGLATHDQTD